MARVKAKECFQFCIDIEVGRARNWGEEWTTDDKRAQMLEREGYVCILDEKEKMPEEQPKKKSGRKKKE